MAELAARGDRYRLAVRLGVFDVVALPGFCTAILPRDLEETLGLENLAVSGAGYEQLVGSIVCDPHICDIEATVLSIFNRLEGKVTPTGAPLTRVLLLALPDAAAFIEATL